MVPRTNNLCSKERKADHFSMAPMTAIWSKEVVIAVLFHLDSLLAGIPQKVKFTVTTGHYTVKNGDSLQLSNVEAMLILCQAENRAVVYSNSRGKAG
jgi:hypothetical protein